MSITSADPSTGDGECAVPEHHTDPRAMSATSTTPRQSSSRAAVRPSRWDRSAAQALDDDGHPLLTMEDVPALRAGAYSPVWPDATKNRAL
jgi:hypothetical protein